MRALLIVAVIALIASCGSNPKPAEAPKALVEAPRPRDETRRFPQANQVSTEVVTSHILGKSFMPGGTVAHYKKGKVEYDLFLSKMPAGTNPALVLPDWRAALEGAKLIPSFGGYFGNDNGKPVFVFSKGTWIAGVVGLPQKDADLEARTLAGRIE